MDHRAEQPPCEDRLARRIIDRYGQSPGLISTTAILRQVGRLNRFSVGRLPLLASLQRRYAPARTYLAGGRSEFRYAWPFAAPCALALASASMPTAGRGESSAPAITAPRPPGREVRPADRTPAGDRGTASVQRQPVNPTDRPIRRVVRQAEPKVPMPVVQSAGQSASIPRQAGSMDLHRGLEEPFRLSANSLPPLAKGGGGDFGFQRGELATLGIRQQSLPLVDSSRRANNPIPPVTQIQHMPDRVNLGGAVDTGTVDSIGELTPPFSKGGLGGIFWIPPTLKSPLSPLFQRGEPIFSNSPAVSFKGGNRTFSEFANRVTVQRAAQSATPLLQHMPLAMLPKPVMMRGANTPQVQTQSAGEERLSSPGGPIIEEAPLQGPTARSVSRRGEGPEYGLDDLVDKVLRQLKRQLAVESERRGWRRWP